MLSDPGHYRMTFDPERSFMRLVFAGGMSEATFDAFEADLKSAKTATSDKSGRPGIQRILVDARNQAILPQSDVIRMQMIVAKHVSSQRRTALILSTHMLQKLQVKRVSSSQTDAVFESEDKAVAWLFEDEVREHEQMCVR